MAEHALSYLIALVIVCNVGVMLVLAAIVVLVPRATRRRPSHRAETASLGTRLTLIASRQGAPRTPAVRAA